MDGWKPTNEVVTKKKKWGKISNSIRDAFAGFLESGDSAWRKEFDDKDELARYYNLAKGIRRNEYPDIDICQRQGKYIYISKVNDD